MLSISERTEAVETMQKTGMQGRFSSKGLSLIELIVMIIILSILAAVAVQKYSDIRRDAADASAKGLLSALRTANKLLYAKKLIAGTSLDYTLGDVASFVDNVHVDHVNYSNRGMKCHVRIAGQQYWYTMSSPGTGFPSIVEWKHDAW